MSQYITRAWYNNATWIKLLWPLSCLYALIVRVRRFLYQHHWFKTTQVAACVIVVGNITVGGTGKTPFVIWLANFLRQQGFQPGIVSRGYGATAKNLPREVTVEDTADIVGDEPLLLAKHSGCPVVIAPKRVLAAQYLLAHHTCDIIISDDGLQHYALARQLEIAIIDKYRSFGNALLLPSGPLREPIQRLKTVDFCLVNGDEAVMTLKPIRFVNVANPEKTCALETFHGNEVHAVAGIGNPERFFTLLGDLGLSVIEHAFPDHAVYRSTDFEFEFRDTPIIMTEKDAVKCRRIANRHCWYLEVVMQVDETVQNELLTAVRKAHG